ncbi:conserved membrane hypothetical protein [Tenacibaculum dicentrarchi]|uniref:Uncharacterized protein n=1 Tax=Tenacibaculum dicentrarchi TaxID=669041 RepID=A0ABM9NZR9_9FLAO|nr:conserved membrane hypothetical protein [Tenacibaculum dicentrarchi]
MTTCNMIEQINNYGNINLAFLGISLTIFTVLYSFILNYRENLKHQIKEVFNGNNSPSIKQKISFLKRNIRSLKKVNFYLKLLIISTFLLFTTSQVIIDFVDCHYFLKIYSLIFKVIFYIKILYCSIILFEIFRYYEKHT